MLPKHDTLRDYKAKSFELTVFESNRKLILIEGCDCDINKTVIHLDRQTDKQTQTRNGQTHKHSTRERQTNKHRQGTDRYTYNLPEKDRQTNTDKERIDTHTIYQRKTDKQTQTRNGQTHKHYQRKEGRDSKIDIENNWLLE